MSGTDLVPREDMVAVRGGDADGPAVGRGRRLADDRLQDMAFHGQMDVRLLGGGGRVTGMRAKGKGMSADMGVSMPGAKESDDDWL